jgi:lipopolysaccharide/colanic/teichoic acid biosynthesis glycosyltransferase
LLVVHELRFEDTIHIGVEIIFYVLAPLLVLVAILIKLDSPGPVLYSSERIGKKGHVFSCTKFRTMVRDAPERRRLCLRIGLSATALFLVAGTLLVVLRPAGPNAPPALFRLLGQQRRLLRR